MAVSFKIYKLFDRYRNLLRKQLAAFPKGGMGSGKGGGAGRTNFKRGVRSKNRIMDFYLKNERFPRRDATSKIERELAQRFENYVSKAAGSYDVNLRRIALALGRKPTGKRKHDVAGFKKQIMEFIKENGRVPSTASGEKIPGEGNLRHKLDYYTKNCNDMTLLGMVYKEDPCHCSGIPMKFRPFLNQQLDVSKPLIRLVK